MPPIPLRQNGKRPVWVTIVMVVVACVVWFGQQKGWLGKGGSQSSQQTSSQSSSQQSGPAEQQGSSGGASGPVGSTQTASNTSQRPPLETQDRTQAAKGGGNAATANAGSAKASSKDQPRPKGTVTAAEIDDSEVENMSARERAERTPVSGDQLDELFKQEKNLIWVEGTGKVTRVLADDTEGDKHQKFLMKNSDGHEVMVAHNIDLSGRAPVKEGDTIKYRGEYIWTERGGKIHFTHKPKYGDFKGGWIEVGGKKYE